MVGFRASKIGAMRAWRDRNWAPQRITSLMVVFDPTVCYGASASRFSPDLCHVRRFVLPLQNVTAVRRDREVFFLFLMNAIAQFQSAGVVKSMFHCPAP